LLALLLILSGGCGSRANDSAPSPPPKSPSHTPAPRREARGEKIRVEDGAGKLLFALDPSDKGFHVEAVGGQKIGSVKVEADRVKVADADDRPAFKVKRKEDGFKLYREPATAGGADVELADVRVAQGFSPGRGSDFSIRSAAGQELYRGKPKEARTKVTGPGGRVFDVKPKENGAEVEDASGKRLIRLKGLTSPAAATFCAAPEYDLLQKAAVVAYLAKSGS
jgi:hypothetical protein